MSFILYSLRYALVGDGTIMSLSLTLIHISDISTYVGMYVRTYVCMYTSTMHVRIHSCQAMSYQDLLYPDTL